MLDQMLRDEETYISVAVSANYFIPVV